MKRLCLMALSLVLFSFSGFAQEKWFSGGDVIIDDSGMPVPFPDVIDVNQTAWCERNVSLQGANTYIIKGTFDLGDYDLTANGANIILTSTGSIVRTENSKSKGVGTNVSGGSGIISGANIYVNGGQIGENVTLSGCTMFSRTASGMATTIARNQWNFIGLYDNTDLQAFSSVSNESNKVWALQYDYANGDWDNNYCTSYSTHFDQGEGVFVYPENQTTIPFTVTPITQDVRIDKDIQVTSTYNGSKAPGRSYYGWVALSNPFVESIYVSRLVDEITPAGGFSTDNFTYLQGGCVYTYNGGTWATRHDGRILPGQGFFIYLRYGEESGSMGGTNNAIFDLKYEWRNPPTSSKAPSRDFLTVSVSTDGYKVPVMFAQNDMASEEYDIYDANKMFGSGSVAEPYLVCNGIELCKEEVSSANYTATMNIKSSESRSVEIVADNIPEGYSLTLLDGALEMEMSEGDVYTTDIAEGENADRFKLLITKNNVSIADVAEAESIRVVNNNRSIRVYGGKSVRTEVYNALGQKVYETSDRAFDLNNVASGAYVLRVQDGKSVNSTKIVVE
ncbi:MAG: T9SS type A sorting domain-containing protein [Bacteroidales bacterium]|nr:T9SS type A sorting domain-containing protein [Bacteroidales bacterium]